MDTPPTVRFRPLRSRRWKIGILVAFYLAAFSATIPFIETGQALDLGRIHAAKAAQCRQFEAAARADGRDEDSRRLAHSARGHDRFAAAYRAEAARTRLTWMTFLIKFLVSRTARYSG